MCVNETIDPGDFLQGEIEDRDVISSSLLTFAVGIDEGVSVVEGLSAIVFFRISETTNS